MSTGTKPFTIVRASDEAWQDSQIEAYTKYLDDRDGSKLTFGDVAPTLFHARPLKGSEIGEVANKVTLRDQYQAAFVRGLLRVENLAVFDEDGNETARREWTRPDDRSGKAKPVPDSDLHGLFDEVTVQEIGMVIRQRSFLARTRGHWYPLPAICQDAALALSRHRAARTSASLPSGATKPPAAPEASPLSPSPPCDESTGATATG